MQSGSATAGGSYAFQAEPRAISGKKAKYRDPGSTQNEDAGAGGHGGTGGGGLLDTANIHFDKRVYRGNTYGQHHRKGEGEGGGLSSTSGTSRPGGSRPREAQSSPFDMGLPRPERMPVDLLPHLVEEVKEVIETTNETQTDEFMPEVPPAEYVPRKTGIDRTTQVEDGELFHFDFEVEPLLDVLVNKTLDQALTEVEEEQEVAAMTDFKKQWYARQEKQALDWKEQVEAERQRQVEKDMKMKLARQAKQREQDLLLKLNAIAAAEAYLPNLGPNAVEDLMADNLFPNATLLAIESEFLPGLFQDAAKEMRKRELEVAMVDDLLEHLATRNLAKRTEARAEMAALAKRRQEEDEARRIAEAKKLGNLRISYEGQEIGPVAVTKDDDIPSLHEKVLAWIRENNEDLAALLPDGVELMIDETPAADVNQLFEAAKADPTSIKLRPVGTAVEENAEAVEGEEGGG